MYSCHFCTHQTGQITEHLDQSFHSNFSKKYHCGYNKCSLFFKCQSSLRKHILRDHQVYVEQNRNNCHEKIERNINSQFICTDELCK